MGSCPYLQDGKKLSNKMIVVRPAGTGEQELAQRMELVRSGHSAYFWDAFVYFFLQELTLECCVLGGAVLFIFCGLSVASCLMLVPVAAVVVAVIVGWVHQASAEKQAQSIRNEIFGLVAEVSGGLLLSPTTGSVPIRVQLQQEKDSSYTQVLGTVSVSQYWGPQNSGWLHALVVHPQWRGRGVARSLAGAARRMAMARGLESLQAAASTLQPAARAALHAAGWECIGAYERPLCGSALSLPLVRLGLDLPLP